MSYDHCSMYVRPAFVNRYHGLLGHTTLSIGYTTKHMQSPVSKTVVSITQLDKLFLVFTILLGLLKSPVVTYVRALTNDAKQCQNAEAKSVPKTVRRRPRSMPEQRGQGHMFDNKSLRAHGTNANNTHAHCFTPQYSVFLIISYIIS